MQYTLTVNVHNVNENSFIKYSVLHSIRYMKCPGHAVYVDTDHIFPICLTEFEVNLGKRLLVVRADADCIALWPRRGRTAYVVF